MRSRPCVDALEDRTSPAVLTVTTTADGGDGSLRNAIAVANADAASGISDTINFHPDLAGATISGGLFVDGRGGAIIIDGSTLGAPVTISGGGGYYDVFLGSIFRVAGDVAFINLRLTNGDALSGGAINNGGSLTLTGCTISGNYAGHRGADLSIESGGGAIINRGSLIIDNCNLTDNHAVYSDGGFPTHGGAIWNSGVLRITNNSTLSGNRAGFEQYGPTPSGYIGHGGAIGNFGGTVIIENSTLSDNDATGDGGGIFNGPYPSNGQFWPPYPGGDFISAGTVTISNSIFFENFARGRGGAIAVFGGSLAMDSSTVQLNSAELSGGGLYVDPAIVTILGCTFSENSAPLGADLFNEDSAVTIIASSIPDMYNLAGTITDPIADLLAQVAALDLNAGQKNSLTSTLQAAQQSLSNTNTTAAVSQLSAFINQFNSLVKSRRLGEIAAEDLVEEAEDLIGTIL